MVQNRAARVGVLLAIAVLVACNAFSGTDDEPKTPAPAEDGGSDGGADATGEANADGGAPPAPGDAAPPSGPPTGNVGTWTFDTQDTCAAWTAHHAAFTWVPAGRNGTGACRLCGATGDPGAPNIEVQLPLVTTTETFSISGYVKAVDGASPSAQVGLYPRTAAGDNVGGLTSSTSVAPSAAWTKSNVKTVTVDRDAGAAAVFAQLALLGAGAGACVDFDDVMITMSP